MATAKRNVADLDKARARRARAIIRGSDRIKSTMSKKDLAEALDAYDDEFLECRDLRHPWRIVGYYRNHGSISRTLECDRCGTKRIDEWSRSGERIGSRYEHPPGFLLKGSGGVSPAQIRKTVIARVDIFASEADLLGSLTNGRKKNGSHR